MLFHKEAFQVFTLYNLQIENAHIYCRFSLKNVLLREKWEKAVNNANNSSEWKAAVSHICSNHFTIQDYVIPPSDNGTCRLKHNAVPTSLPLVNRPNCGIRMNIRQRQFCAITRIAKN